MDPRMLFAAQDSAENAWMGWICPCGGKNLTMKARCTLCGQVKPLSAHQRPGVGKGVIAAPYSEKAFFFFFFSIFKVMVVDL